MGRSSAMCIMGGAMKKLIPISLALVLAVAAFAGNTTHPKISKSKARAIALARAKGTVMSEELEREQGKLVWSFDIRTSDKDITEILVNANDGSIVAVQHETVASEKAEQAKEAKERKH